MRVLTLTANLLAETTCEYDGWQAGGTFRAFSESFQAGGKGINVTRMLRRLGVPTVALCFPGGFTGSRCEAWLGGAGVPHHAFRTLQETRSGWVVRAAGRRETTFLGADNVVDESAAAACAQFLDTQTAKDCLAICGSIPHWEDAVWTELRHALERWSARVPLVADTYGEPLRWLAALPCALVKINRREFAELAGEPRRAATDARMPELLARAAGSRPVQRWVVTDGANRVWSMERDGAPFSVVPPRIQEVSPTGSGDVLLAALLEALFARKLSLAEALEFALPLGAANAASPGVADFDLTPFRLVDQST
ncbi:MAG: 1-phosphofructokinase family hexose kinase [Opitutaceae bacterium]